MSKKDIRLVIATVILIVILIFGFIWDANSNVLGRTLDIEITDDMDVVNMKKSGTLLYRIRYEARIMFPEENLQNIVTDILQTYQVEGDLYDSTEFEQIKSDIFSGGETLVPSPITESAVLVIPALSESGDEICFIFAIEDTGSFMYVYWSKG